MTKKIGKSAWPWWLTAIIIGLVGLPIVVVGLAVGLVLWLIAIPFNWRLWKDEIKNWRIIRSIRPRHPP